MKWINNYKNFILEKNKKGFGERTLAKTKRIVTGTHVGFDPKKGAKYPLNYLPEKHFDKIASYMKEGDVSGAAEYLRTVIIKERDTQFKAAAALITVGALMVKNGISVLDQSENIPEPDVDPDVDPVSPTPDVTLTKVDGLVEKGEGLTQIVNKATGKSIGPGSPAKELIDGIRDTFGGSDLSKGIDNISNISRNPEEIVSALKSIKIHIDANPDVTCGNLFKGNLEGTGKTIGDLLDTIVGGKYTYFK